MKYLFLLGSILLFCLSSYAQTYDLIVNSKGESIACHIDSVSQTDIYFTMKINGNWESTKIKKEDVVDFQYAAIEENMVVFRRKSSYINRFLEHRKKSIHEIQRNSVWLGILTLNYGRLIPLEKGAISLSGGLSMIDGWGAIFLQFESSYLLGGPKHFFEPGLFYFTDYNDHIFLLRTGYRFQANKGFLIRAAPMFTLFEGDLLVTPSLCIGYSF